MKLFEFDYKLPKVLIAQEPIRPRDNSRLLVLHRHGKKMQTTDKHFYDLVNYIQKGDVLVLNNTKVFPARLIGKKKETGGKIEVFLLRKDLASAPSLLRRGSKGELWQCLMAGRGRRVDLKVEFKFGLKAKVLKHNDDGTWLVEFNHIGKRLMDIVNKIGQVPLPPYIKRARDSSPRKRAGLQNDRAAYQTVYANERKAGSVAAPTAGLHFTPRLIKKIKAKGVEIVCITLQVGYGTFAPVKVEDITKHKMHAEWAEASKNALLKIVEAKSDGRRIIAVGTTSVRILESIFTNVILRPQAEESRAKQIDSRSFASLRMTGWKDWVDIFIYPGFKFRIVDALITNFHLPKSTLLMLVSAFAGKKNIDKAYQHAVKKKYHFYSYGDAMFIY